MTTHATADRFPLFKKNALDVYKLCKSIYIGRTHFPERRLVQHYIEKDPNLDQISILGWCHDWDEVKDIETRVIDALKNNSNLCKVRSNLSTDSYGRLTSPWNCVYAVWQRKSDGPLLGSPVRHLTYGNRMTPDFAENFTVRHLHLDAEGKPQAKVMLEAVKSTRSKDAAGANSK